MMEVAQLLGTVVFAISGVVAVAERKLDWFGVLVVGAVTAVGGGTMRDLILGRAPVFWIEDDKYLLFALLGGLAAIPLVRHFGTSHARFERGLVLLDALGLSLFAVTGAQLTLELGFDGPTAVVCGILTGVGGGVIRDLLAGQHPLILRSDIYATAALAGTAIYVLLVEAASLAQTPAMVVGAVTIFAIRTVAYEKGWPRPSLRH
jgi:uncharacterized membrane protein YeiH